MKKYFDIEKEIEQTLQSLEGLKRADPMPFFYTRLEARMERELVKPQTMSWQIRPVWAYSSLAAAILLNVATIFTMTYYRQEKAISSPQERFAIEYGLNTTSGIEN
jgi:hypothetical protein